MRRFTLNPRSPLNNEQQEIKKYIHVDLDGGSIDLHHRTSGERRIELRDSLSFSAVPPMRVSRYPVYMPMHSGPKVRCVSN